MRLKSITCRRGARRNARRFFKVRVEHLQVVLSGDAFAVADPRADDVSGEHFRQFGLPGRSEVGVALIRLVEWGRRWTRAVRVVFRPVVGTAATWQSEQATPSSIHRRDALQQRPTTGDLFRW